MLIEPDLITRSVIVSADKASKEILHPLLGHNKNLRVTAELFDECEPY